MQERRGGGRIELGRGEEKQGRREEEGEYTHYCPTKSELRILRHIKIISNEIKC